MFAYEKESCNGCFACAEVCPTKAISIDDSEGYFYPVFDLDLCIDCNQCIKSCAYNNRIEDLLNRSLKTYAVHHKILEERRTSRSGGVFVAIAEHFLKYNGVVYGCIIDDSFEAKHIRADSKDRVDLMKGSKYLQSGLKGTYSSVLLDLKKSKKVLFVGTPCQVAGLKNYLSMKDKGSFDNILFCDLLCHGVSSGKILTDYIEYISERTGGQVKSFSFRDKTFGWKSSIESFTLETGEKYFSNIFSGLYNSNCALRESCYRCPYARKERIGDLSIGDFWINKEDVIHYGLKSFCDRFGTSVLFVNNSKGIEIFEAISESIDCIDVSNMDYSQPALSYPVKKPENALEFWNVYNQKGFEAACRYLFYSSQRPASVKSKIKSYARKMYISTFGRGRWFDMKF